jgi:hypothetical protein
MTQLIERVDRMNKKTAKEMAYSGGVTYGQLQDLIDRCDHTAPCKINKNITRKQALGIMGGAIKGKPRNEIPNTTFFNHRDKLTLTGEGINVMNILVECSAGVQFKPINGSK